MNDEIKNILDMLKDSVNNPILEDVDSYAEETYEYPNYFALDPNTKDCKLLLDYITNLQRENDKLKEQCKQWKENHKAVCIQRDNILNNTVKDIEEQIDYKSRINKAIDKLNTQLAFTSSYQLNYQIAMNIIEETKSVLQGSDKE